uniref:Axonemal dynein light chain domain containing 1 n=1 Tax=Propithecus coquereli TaxID=379532 RepID=A0A2K6FRC2_PROCO
MSLPKTPSTRIGSASTSERTNSKASAAREDSRGLPELREKKNMVDRSKPLPTSLQNEFIPQEVLLSLTCAANAGPCPENLLPPKKIKTPKDTLPRSADHVWHNPIRRNKFKYLIDHPVSLTGAGRDISFLYDVKYVRGETRENTVCPPQLDRSLQPHDGVIVPHKPKTLTDTLIPEEFHIVSNTGVSGLECYDEKPNKRVEVVKLNDVMDAMLERAGTEIQEYTGPTKVIAKISVTLERYVQLLDQIARQMIDFYKDLVTQRVMDQRILEELCNFKHVIEELTRELCLVRAHDVKLTKEVEKAHRDLARALLDAEKNFVYAHTHKIFTQWNNKLITLSSVRVGWAVIERNRVILAKRLYLNEKGWNKYTKHFIILLSTKDTADLALLQKLMQRWRSSVNKFKQEIEHTEETTKETLQMVKDSLIKWQQFFRNHKWIPNLSPNRRHTFDSVLLDFKQWQKVRLSISNERLGNHSVLAFLTEPARIFFRRCFCHFRLSLVPFPEALNGIKLFIFILLDFSSRALQENIFNMMQQWLLKIGNEINNGNIELQRHIDELHIAMIQWMVNLLIVMIPDFADQDTLPRSEEEGAEKHDIGVAQLELDAIALTKKLSQYSSYLSSCCKGLVTTVTLNKAFHSEKGAAKELHELDSMKRECYEWINTCSHLLSDIKGREIKLFTYEETEHLLGEEEAIKLFIEPEIDMSFKEDEEESEEDKKLKEKNEEEKQLPASTEKEKLIRFIGEDKNIHSKPLLHTDELSSWRKEASQGTLAQKYLEAMAVIEYMQDKLTEVKSRARQAEEKFEDANEKLHYALIRNSDLEKELEEIAGTSRKKEPEREEENEREREGEGRPANVSSESLKKGKGTTGCLPSSHLPSLPHSD